MYETISKPDDVVAIGNFLECLREIVSYPRASFSNNFKLPLDGRFAL